MHYAIRHTTLFQYSSPVRESVMELRLQPRSEGPQALRSFQISTNPRAQLYAYSDSLGNAVYHFNILRQHRELRIDTQSVVEMSQFPEIPDALDSLEWDRFNSFNLGADHFDMMEPSKFARRSETLEAFCRDTGLERSVADPLSALRNLNTTIFQSFGYEQGVTEVHSPIDDALRAKRGVCQDFAHIMIAIARGWGIPARYVSGYLFHRTKSEHRSGEDASHAWIEAWLPSLGWVGFDPTNNVLAQDRHIRVAVGRDYADVPPTRGTFKGDADTDLQIAVTVSPAQAPIRHEEFLRVARPERSRPEHSGRAEEFYHQQQQQQQQ